MKKLLLIIAVLFLLSGCMESSSSDVELNVNLKSTNTNVVLADLRSVNQVFRTTNGDFVNQIGTDYNQGIDGKTKDGYSFHSEAFCSDPSEGYTFVNETCGHFLKGISIYCNIDGTATSLKGTLKGVDDTKYVWVDEEPVTDGWSQQICSINVMVAGSNTSYQNRYVPFYYSLTKDGDNYNFCFTFTEPITDVTYVSIDFNIFTNEYPAPLSSFTLTSLYLMGNK